MIKPKIAIIGANESISFLIDKAKEKGYETHVFAWQCGDPGEDKADYFYPISVSDKEKILEVCQSIDIVGVCSITSDFAVNTVNYVARHLGLVGNSEKTDLVARNKYFMRKAFKDAGVYTPEFTRANKDSDLFVYKNHKFPVIVKPTDRWSSKGVTRVDSYEQLQEAVNYAISESLTHEAIIEDFMEGPEYSAECICQNGKCHILAYTKKMTTGYPHYVETGHMEPAQFDDSLQRHLEEVIYKSVSALDIKNSAAHVEFRVINNQEIGIIEIGARMGGDYIGTDLVRLSTGNDYIGLVIDVACNKSIKLESNGIKKKVYVKFITNEKDYDDIKEIQKNSRYIVHRLNIFNKDFSKEILNSSDRHGYLIYGEK